MLILFVGIVLLIYSLTMSKYTDQESYYQLCDGYMSNTISKEYFYQQVENISTNKMFIMDIGNGLITFSLFCLILSYYFKIRKWYDCLRTKAMTKVQILLLANIAWMMMIPGTYIYYYFRVLREDYPSFADTINIPIMIQTIFLVLCIMPINLFILLTVWKSNLSTRILVFPKHCTFVTIAWEVVFSIILLLNIFCLILFIIDGDHISIIVSLCFLYILLSMRAGKINYLNEGIVSKCRRVTARDGKKYWVSKTLSEEEVL
jgi:hypothetical protein